MARKSVRFKLLLLCALGLTIQSPAQPDGGAGARRGGMSQVSSPVVNPDNTVTFNYSAPTATNVKVNTQFSGTTDMVKKENGVWSITLGPVAPDIYPYSFIVDGITIMDPKNPEWFPNETFKNSLVDIRGDSPLIHSIQTVPHGGVDYIDYYSNTMELYGSLVIYTPPSYDHNPNKKYPVFYLISGTTDTEETYFKVGRTNFIIDNLIAQGAAKEMIIVMPYGNPMKYYPSGTNLVGKGDIFTKDFLNDLMPFVENNYRTINEQSHRGIGGFSRGGGQAMRLGLGNLDKFSYVCSYSSFIGANELREIYEDPERTNKMLNLFWLGVGTDDFLYEGAKEYMDLLDQHGVKTVKVFTSDKFGHTWMNAKYFLDQSLRLLF